MVNRMDEFLNQAATQSAFAGLVGVSQQAISKQIEKGVLKPGASLRAWLLDYCERLREEAGGRGGDSQLNLTKQRAEESMVKTAMMRLEYNKQIGELVPAEDAALVITDWCSAANREYRSGISKLIGEIQSKFKIDIPPEMVESIANPTFIRIQDHAKRLGRDLVEGVHDVHAPEVGADGGVD